MNTIAADYITEENGKFTVYSRSGKAMGSYPSREEADKRLKQIEYFKNSGGAVDMAPGEMEKLRALLDKFFVEEGTESNHQPKIAAGVVLMAPSGRVLLLKRADDEPNYGGHWGLPGGKAEEGETPEQAARRELAEETGIAELRSPFEELSTVATPTGMQFTTFLCRLAGELTPTLTDGEHTAWLWIEPGNIGTRGTGDDTSNGLPIHPGVREALAKLFQSVAADALALDKDSVRTIDDAGRMHVKSAHISKATVNPYYGREIPGWEQLGLDPDRIYQLFRDPAELKKAAPTFNGIQLLIRHIPVSAEDPQRDEIVGTTGTNAEFNHPFLDNELVVWTQNGINAIESENQRELSCGYGYTPVMEPGEFEGVRYDGRMTNIKGNHVALVSKGRAGPDVVVGDAALTEQPPKEGNMKMTITAVRLHSALMAGVLAPKIALDQQLKASTALATSLSAAKLGRADLKDPAKRTAVVKMARDAAEPALAPEAKKAGIGPDDVIMRVLDMVEGQVAADPAEQEIDPAAAPAAKDWRAGVMDALMKSGMDEKAAGAICDMFPSSAEPGEDEEEADDETPEEKAAREKADKEKTEKAMDEAIKLAVDKQVGATVTAAVEAERQRSKDAAEARQFVEPWVGKVSLAHDSAEDIYRASLGMLGVKHEAVKDPAALKILVEAQPKPNARRQHVSMTTDAAPEGKTFTDMFPGAERIGHAA